MLRAALAKREADTPILFVAATLRALNDKKPKPRVVVGKGASDWRSCAICRTARPIECFLNAFGMAKLRG
jgi:hypothetical protein